MNAIAIIILAAIFFDFILNLAADILNLRVAGTDLPAEFQGVYDPKRYRKSQEYLKARTRFAWTETVFDLCVILVFWFGKGFPLVDNWARSFGYGPVVTGLIFMGVLILAKGILQLPFSVYDTFVIEERFGFNKTSWPTFVADIFKALGLSIVLGSPLLAGILAFFEYAGAMAWLYCWGAVSLYMLVVQFIAPAWIMPLFFKFQPLENGELKDAIMAYARSVDYPVANVFVIDGSRRSAKSNAFFTGFGKNKRIALFDTLVERHTVSELVAILAHEIGHFKKKHVIWGFVAGLSQTGLTFWLLSIFVSYQGLFDAFFVNNTSVYAGMIFFGMLYTPIAFFMNLGMQAFSRRNEFQADQFATETTADPESMSNALKKLSAHNMSNLFPHPFYVVLNYSHPPVPARLRRISGGKESGTSS